MSINKFHVDVSVPHPSRFFFESIAYGGDNDHDNTDDCAVSKLICAGVEGAGI